MTESGTCTGCKWATKKWKFLGWRPYCSLYKAIRDVRCIDWSRRV